VGEALRLYDALTTHVGAVRAANEDSVIALPQAGFWVVADGMGGHANGKLASQTIVDHVARIDWPDKFEDACIAAADALHAANTAVFAEAESLGERMGSTVVSLLVRGRQFAVLWAGDSRAYLYREGQLHHLSTDHTQVQEMIDRGLLTPEQAAGHPMGHVLARAVGVSPALELDAVSDVAHPGDVFLLCSDGLHSVLNDREITTVLAVDGRAATDVLVSWCLERGAPDNVSVIVVSAHEPTALSFLRVGEMS